MYGHHFSLQPVTDHFRPMFSIEGELKWMLMDVDGMDINGSCLLMKVIY